MNPNEYLEELKKILDEYRFGDVGPLTGQIIPSEFSDMQAKKALGLMRRKRLFSEMEKAASLFYFAGHQAPVVRRQWAQALLDQNRVAQGLSTLETMAKEVKDDPHEGPEVRGLIGRAYKQLYINKGNKDDLVKAIHAYRSGWHARKGDYRWHGINLAALLARAKQDGVDPGVDDQDSEIAHQILKDIEELRQNAGVWDYGTAMEASIALHDHDGGLKWARQYARHPAADAFELASTIRQMKEVWKLERTEIGDKLLPVLEYELLQREGGVLELTSSSPTDRSGFEAVYGNEGYIYAEWIDTMHQCCGSVARVFDPKTGECWGTGFPVRGSALRKKWGDELVFMTNAHVISKNPVDEAPLAPGEGAVEFTRLENHPKIELGELLFSSPKVELDVSVLRIQAPDKILPLEPSIYLPTIPKEGSRPQRIYIIGHPKGEKLAISLYDNRLVAYQEDRYVHYSSPTEGGSSGSPVFSRKWKLFAIHHRARKELQVNEGVLFEPIKKATSS